MFDHGLCCCPSIFILNSHENRPPVSTFAGQGGACLWMSRRTAMAAARDSGVRTFHCFLVTDLATLRVRIDITGARAASNRSNGTRTYRDTARACWICLFGVFFRHFQFILRGHFRIIAQIGLERSRSRSRFRGLPTSFLYCCRCFFGRSRALRFLLCLCPLFPLAR